MPELLKGPLAFFFSIKIDFYKNRVIPADPKPNAAHRKLAELEKAGKLIGVVTQNIDGLHQAAGSKKVLELHGSILRAYCSRCRKPYPQEVMNYVLKCRKQPDSWMMT